LTPALADLQATLLTEIQAPEDQARIRSQMMSENIAEFGAIFFLKNRAKFYFSIHHSFI